MNLKDMFEKEFLFESSKKEDKKTTKIFYKLDIRLKKKEEEKPEEAPEANAAPAVDQTSPAPEAGADNAPVDLSMGGETGASPDALDTDNGMMAAPPPLPDNGAAGGETLSVPPLASVVTEDDDKDKVEVNDEDNIIRKMEGEIVVDKEEVNDIQSIDDIISYLAEKENDGVKILDEFSADIIQALVNPATQQEVKDKVDKESKIFAEIIYGKKTDDSVGIRLIKRKNSELVTTSMLIDNKILNAAYSKDILDKRITEYRNNECGAE